MAKVMIEMESEQVDAIMIGELKWHIETFRKDLERREKGEGAFIFDNDPKADVVYLNEYIEAFKLVFEYYGGKLDADV